MRVKTENPRDASRLVRHELPEGFRILPPSLIPHPSSRLLPSPMRQPGRNPDRRAQRDGRRHRNDRRSALARFPAERDVRDSHPRRPFAEYEL